MTDLLQARNLSKRFGRQVALDNVSLDLACGEIHALIGENGAGKSTLAAILAGSLPTDDGEILVDGQRIRQHSPRMGVTLGIAYVPQTAPLVAVLSLIDNCVLAGSGLFARRTEARERLLEAVRTLDATLPLDVPTATFDSVQRQMGSLALGLATRARILLLDEPTACLGPAQVDALIRTLRRLANSGLAVGLVTHRYAEVRDAADRVTVLRAGHVVHHGAAAIDPLQFSRLILGKQTPTPILDGKPAAPSKGRTRLTVDSLCVAGRHRLQDLSFTVAAGERLGIAAIDGNALSVLARCITGLTSAHAGTIHIDGVEVGGQPAVARRCGVRWVPDERANGAVDALSAAENLSLLQNTRDERRLGLRDRRVDLLDAKRQLDEFGISPSDPKLPVAALSGGNRQRLVLARELQGTPALIIAHGPARGLDIAAAERVGHRLQQSARQGAAVLLLSSDWEELFANADRILVLAKGRLSAEFDCRTGPPDPGEFCRALTGDDREALSA